MDAEGAITRGESSRSLEDAPRQRAIQTLKEVGLLTPVDQTDTFHGRVGKKGEAPWAVDPKFANGSNDSGNHNVNNRPTLYSGDQDTASEFAHARTKNHAHRNYLKLFEEKVRQYTPRQKLEWLARLNQPDNWGRQARKNDYTEEDIHSNDQVRNEAFRKSHNAPEEERLEAWGIATKDAGVQAEIHRIVAAHPDATVIDSDFDFSVLTDEQRQKYTEALKALVLPTTQGSPVAFDAAGGLDRFRAKANELKRPLLSTSDVDDFSSSLGIDPQTTLQLVSAYNAFQLAYSRPADLAYMLLGNTSDIFTDKIKVGEEEIEAPVNLEYIQKYFREAHIVGTKQIINSATLGKAINSVSFFDLNRVGTEAQLAAQKRERTRALQGLKEGLPGIPQIENAEDARLLLEQLHDPHVRPERLIEAARKIPGYDQILDADAGNWEKFTLAEHTETVLRNFDENFADSFPIDLLPAMRLAIVVHDLGKPEASAKGEKRRQKEYNDKYAHDFMGKVGVSENLQNLIGAMIGDGSDYVFRTQFQPSTETQAAQRTHAEQTLKAFYNSGTVHPDQVDAFIQMCRVLQISDGGAYTSMAVTRREGKGTFRNAPSFNNSFAAPSDVGKRDLRYREPDEPPAPQDLTPKAPVSPKK